MAAKLPRKTWIAIPVKIKARKKDATRKQHQVVVDKNGEDFRHDCINRFGFGMEEEACRLLKVVVLATGTAKQSRSHFLQDSTNYFPGWLAQVIHYSGLKILAIL
ncbi:MAG: hypothetical protein IPP73_05015 [Chitinophagaceae bacterium]|nr:hypothetical protein [Chitinophagaceae bacterium]